MPIELVRKPKWFPGVAFVALGTGLLVASFVLANGTREFLRNAAVASGVVIDARSGTNHPLIEFELPSGEKAAFATGGWISGYKVGRQVRVLYRPESPVATARLDDPGTVWFGTGATAVFGTGQLLVGLLAMFVRSKEEAQED
jgi:Protein of unknown function (DUF3592)